MSSRNSAAYKGVLALLLRQGAIDWTYSKEPINPTIFEDQQVDVALIFPKAWCEKHGVSRERRDSIVNKTPLTHRTRRIMGNQAPSTLPEATGDGGRAAVQLAGRHSVDAPRRRAVSTGRRSSGRGGEQAGLRRVLRGAFG